MCVKGGRGDGSSLCLSIISSNSPSLNNASGMWYLWAPSVSGLPAITGLDCTARAHTHTHTQTHRHTHTHTHTSSHTDPLKQPPNPPLTGKMHNYTAKPNMLTQSKWRLQKMSTVPLIPSGEECTLKLQKLSQNIRCVHVHLYISDLQSTHVKTQPKLPATCNSFVHSLCETDIPGIFWKPVFIMFTFWVWKIISSLYLFKPDISARSCQRAEHNHKSQGEMGFVQISNLVPLPRCISRF